MSWILSNETTCSWCISSAASHYGGVWLIGRLAPNLQRQTFPTSGADPQTTTWCLMLVLVAPWCLYHIGSGAKIYRLSLQTSIEQSGPTSPPGNKGINPWQCCWTCTIVLLHCIKENTLVYILRFSLESWPFLPYRDRPFSMFRFTKMCNNDVLFVTTKCRPVQCTAQKW